MKYQPHIFLLVLFAINGCGNHSTADRDKANLINLENKLIYSEVEKKMFSALDGFLDLRKNSSYEKLSQYFHILEWESTYDVYPELRDQIKPGLFLENKIKDVGNSYDWVDSYFVENIVSKFLSNQSAVFVVNYRIETTGKRDFIVNQNQILLESKDGGNSWKYYRVDTEDCIGTINKLIEYYSSNCIYELKKGLCATNKPQSQRDRFVPGNNEEKNLVINIDKYVQHYFLGTPMQGVNYLPDELFEFVNDQMGGEYTFEEVKKMVAEEVIELFQKDLKKANVAIKLHQLLNRVETTTTIFYAMSYSTVITPKNDPSHLSEMGGELICILYKNSNTWKFIENDNEQTVEILKNMLPIDIVEQLLNYKFKF
jgi:hypothetical protein